MVWYALSSRARLQQLQEYVWYGLYVRYTTRASQIKGRPSKASGYNILVLYNRN